MFRWFPALSLLLLLSSGYATALTENGTDLPFLGRYPGSVIDNYKSAHYDEMTIPLGPLGKNGLTRAETLEGQITYIKYKVPQDRSPLEVIRNYQQALQQAGFHILWQCANHACRTNNDAALNTALWRNAATGFTGGVENFLFDNGRMLTAEHRSSDGIRTLVFINDNTLFGHSQDASVYAIQTKPMQNARIHSNSESLTTESMLTALNDQGRFAMHLPFDFNQAALSPDAQTTLVSLIRLLKQHPTLRIRLEGHTDQVGSASYNQKLSLNRATAVKKALMAQGIASQRLDVVGYGDTRPLASNTTEIGRAQNRRVEVVKLTLGRLAAAISTPFNTASATTSISSVNNTPTAENTLYSQSNRATQTSPEENPSAELNRTVTNAIRSETNHQIEKITRNFINGVLGN
ncbi:MAG: OmpA family protein [Acidithiobacillus sp.]